ncbi:unnamed protein product [Pieris macdunnoughi]|uniref:Peptidase aspartic putative domain-containing protein n=1 Tax=Pieris macdunnoughi TaxID=345717 RepID=A0A821PXC2_9NEOP|nr:unnamed protein product [Pieris macdunnoughi]
MIDSHRVKLPYPKLVATPIAKHVVSQRVAEDVGVVIFIATLRSIDRSVTTSEGESTSTGTMTEQSKGKLNSIANDVHFVTNFSKENCQNSVLLATAEVLVESRNGCKHIIRAFLDQGSQASFITEATVQLLNLTRRSVSGWVSGVGKGQMRIKYMFSLSVKSRHDPKTIIRVNAYVLRSVTTLLPTTKLSAPKWSDLETLELAESAFKTPGRIDILLGADVYSNILLHGIIKHPRVNLLAQRTCPGWVLSGKLPQ